MNEQERSLQELIDQRVEAAKDRAWAERLDGAQITLEEARQKVTEVLRSQLVDRPGSSKAPGMSIHIGMLELQGVFPSLPSPPSEAEVVDAIERSSTDYKTFQALRLSARLGFSDQYPALKAWERDLISGLVNEPPLPKGPSNARDAQRNMLIVSQIRQLDVAGFKPMRNEATSARTSGCDIVADVMTDLGNPMTYSAVEAVWKNRDKAPQPKFLADLLVEGVLRKLPDQGEPTSEK